MAVTPLMVELAHQTVVIIGGGRVATRRTETLLESGAILVVVSPEVNERLRSLSEKGFISWKQKAFEDGDVEGAFLVIVATNDARVNERVIHACPANTLLNVASCAMEGNVHFPAHLQRGKLSISISTNGASPMLSANIRNDLQTIYDKRYETYVDFLYECRQLMKASYLNEGDQKKILKELLSDSYLSRTKQGETLSWLKQLCEKEPT